MLDRISEALTNSHSPKILNAITAIFQVTELEQSWEIPSGYGSMTTIALDSDGRRNTNHEAALAGIGMSGMLRDAFSPATGAAAAQVIQWCSHLVNAVINS